MERKESEVISQDYHKELTLWKSRFKISFYATPIITIVFFLLQALFTSEQLSTDFKLIENWVGFSSTFKLPIGVFTSMVAITSLIGMYFRSIQVSHQLNKIEKQLDISQQQFNLANKKENFVLFIEHRKALSELVKLELKEQISYQSNIFQSRDFKSALCIDSQKLYKKLFPENSPEEMVCFDLWVPKSKEIINIEVLSEKLYSLSNLDLLKVNLISLYSFYEMFLDFGVVFQINSYGSCQNKGGIEIAYFFIDFYIVINVLPKLGLIEETDTQRLRGKIISLALDINDSLIPE